MKSRTPPLAPPPAFLLTALLVPILMLCGCTGIRNVSDRDIQMIDLEKVLALIDRQEEHPDEPRLLLLDSRAEKKYRAGHIPGARHMLTADVNPEFGRDPAIDVYDRIVIYADNPGSASAKALAKLLMSLRYDGVRLFPGGLRAWKNAGLPIESEQ